MIMAINIQLSFWWHQSGAGDGWVYIDLTCVICVILKFVQWVVLSVDVMFISLTNSKGVISDLKYKFII